MSFGNPVVAGGILQVPGVESLGYIAGVAGWIIERSGNAEFNNLTIRGTFFGADFEVTSAGVFFYSAAPALGDLVISLAYTAGTDAYGNVYPAGLQILNHGGSNAAGIAIGYAGTKPLIYFLASLPAILNDPAFLVNITGAGAAQYATLVMSGGEDSTQTDYIAIALDSSSADGTHLPTVNVQYIDPSAGAHTLLAASLAGLNTFGLVKGLQPGTGTSRANVGAAEVWHSATALMGAGWTTTGAGNPLRYRFEAANVIRLDGQALTTAATAAGSTVATLPVGWQNATFHAFTTPSAIDVTANQSTVEVFAAGVIKATQAFTAAGQSLFFDGVTFPLD